MWKRDLSIQVKYIEGMTKVKNNVKMHEHRKELYNFFAFQNEWTENWRKVNLCR